MSDTKPYTDEDVQALAEMLLADYDVEYNADHLSWRDFEGEARTFLDTFAPAIIRRAKAEALREAADDIIAGRVVLLRARADEIEAGR